MKQGLLAFQYEQEKGSMGMTGLSGLMTYVELMQAAGLRSSVERHVRLRERGQGRTDSQMIISLMLLNLAGGESVSDLDLLEKDRGLCRMLGEFETCGMRLSERRALEKRWRVERRRSVPSESAVFRYLERFHDVDEESKREDHRAFIPAPNGAMKGLRKVNADLVGFVQSRSPQTDATLDMDATLVETRKQEALPSYKKHRAYQPLITYWSEAELIVHSEFRDGNVPAGHQQLRVLIEALGRLPAGVEKVMLRSDTAGYQRELLMYCAEGRDERFGVIEFAVGVDVTTEFRRAVSEVAEQDWQTLYRKVGEHRVDTGQQWADVNFVPNWIGHSKNSPEYRFIATRERLIEQPLPGMEGQMELPFPAMELSNRGWYKVFGVVTNRSIAADELIWWSRQRCGKGEEVHSVLKSALAGGRLPSGLFGANAAWWAISVLAFNLNSAMKRLVLGKQWVGASEGGALRPDRPTGPCDASRQEVDHPSGPWPSLIRVAAQGAAEDIGAGCRAVSSIATLLGASVCRRLCRVARPGHAFFGLTTAIIGSEPLPIPSKTAPETLSDARSCHASPLVDTRTPPESTPSSSQPCQGGNLGVFMPLTTWSTWKACLSVCTLRPFRRCFSTWRGRTEL